MLGLLLPNSPLWCVLPIQRVDCVHGWKDREKGRLVSKQKWHVGAALVKRNVEQGRQTANAWGMSSVVAAFQEISQFDDRDLQRFVRQAERQGCED